MEKEGRKASVVYRYLLFESIECSFVLLLFGSGVQSKWCPTHEIRKKASKRVLVDHGCSRRFFWFFFEEKKNRIVQCTPVKRYFFLLLHVFLWLHWVFPSKSSKIISFFFFSFFLLLVGWLDGFIFWELDLLSNLLTRLVCIGICLLEV